jgi:hypothetical protein
MPKILHGKPNGWAYDFYRATEDYIYGVLDIKEYRERLVEMNCSREFIEELADAMTNPPAIDYSEDE